jgi:Alcohol dehydrogenase GroES-like domain/WYL domain
VGKLRELGYPVLATRGPTGGYRLGAGAAMPPLLLDDEEAVAVAVGLRTAAGGAIAGIEDAALRALAKLEQVLPSRLRSRVGTLQSVITPVPVPGAPLVDPDVLTAIAAACRSRERLRFWYLSHDGTRSDREAEPYQLVNWGRRWYLVAFDVRRADWRTFRVDRITVRTPPGGRFAPRPLPSDDLAGWVSQRVAFAGWRYRARVRVFAPAAMVLERIGPGRPCPRACRQVPARDALADRVGGGDVGQFVPGDRVTVERVHADEAADYRSLRRAGDEGEHDGARLARGESDRRVGRFGFTVSAQTSPELAVTAGSNGLVFATARPRAGEVLVALRAAGLNRIDVLVREGGFAAAQMPIVLGAEGAGEVAEIGPGASGFAPGDRVVINPFVACGECPAYAAGRETECPNLRVVGEHFDGTYAEYIALPARSLLSAPDGLGYPVLAASIVAYMTAWHMLKAKGGAVHRAVLPGLRFAGLSTRAARHSRWNQRTESRPGGRLHGTPRGPITFGGPSCTSRVPAVCLAGNGSGQRPDVPGREQSAYGAAGRGTPGGTGGRPGAGTWQVQRADGSDPLTLRPLGRRQMISGWGASGQQHELPVGASAEAR